MVLGVAVCNSIIVPSIVVNLAYLEVQSTARDAWDSSNDGWRNILAPGSVGKLRFDELIGGIVGGVGPARCLHLYLKIIYN